MAGSIAANLYPKPSLHPPFFFAPVASYSIDGGGPLLRVKKLSQNAVLPSRASPLSAGYDLSRYRKVPPWTVWTLDQSDRVSYCSSFLMQRGGRGRPCSRQGPSPDRSQHRHSRWHLRAHR